MKTTYAHLPNVLGITFLILGFASTLLAQSAASENCDLKLLGVADAKSFLSFDKELKEALVSQDAGMLALLLKYPFRVNDDRGSYYLHDAASFSGRAREIFTPLVRETVLNQHVETIWCNYTGIMYGDGVVWVNPKDGGFAIEAVNIPAKSGSPKSVSNSTEFVCSAEKHRVIVDHDKEGKLRYRSWNKPRSLIEKPDLEISGGKQHFEGTGPCVHAIWQFNGGSTNFSVTQVGGCFPDAPKDAIGLLEVSVTGKETIGWLCR